MKRFFKNAIILTIVIFIFASCRKEPDSTNRDVITPPPQTSDTLKGKEFIFSDLIWSYWLDDFSELYIIVENRPDLFSFERETEVYVKSSTDTAWVRAQTYNPNLSPGYVYSIYLKRLYVFPYPYIYPWSVNTQLAGSRVILKVRFL